MSIKEKLESLGRNSIQLKIARKETYKLGATRFGGKPDVPPDFVWPTYEGESYADFKTLEEYGQRQRNINLEDMDMDSWRRVADAFGIPTDEPLAPVLERFRKATQRQPLYQCMFHEDDGSLTESYGLMFE